MDPERWQTIADLFAELADRPERERADRLAAVRAADPDLHAELLSLLAAHDAGGFLDEPPRWDPAAELPADPLEGSRIGPYRVEARIGAGGMGVVYRAVRADDQFRQQVALKLVRRGMDTESVLARFRRERQILAGLDDPRIARLLDGGMAPDGRPFLVMEHVEGLPLDAWCARHEPPLRARLELFLEICVAVQHAHRALVVHRDLKPANILVRPDGAVKLLDFGVAKLLDPGADEPLADLTMPGAPLLTPRYAAPELLRGERVDTGADVWSLGVILHELLTGRPAFNLDGWEATTLARRLEQAPTPRPSAAAGRFAARLRGDLDAIVRGALQVDRASRYASVAALAEDVRRHLDGLPIAARPGSPGYRAARFLRRHALAAGALAVVVVAAIAVAVAMSAQAARIGRQAREAALQRDRAERVTALLVEMFDVSDPLVTRGARGDTMRVREFLLAGRDAVLGRLDGQPLLRADMSHLYGRLLGNLGATEPALDLVEQGLADRRALLGGDHPDVARSLDYLATLRQGRGEYAQAESLFVEALAIRRRALGEEHPETAESLNNLGVLLDTQGRYDQGRPLVEQSLRLRERLLGPRHPEVAQSLNNLAVAAWAQGDAAAADSLYRRALDIRRRALGPRHPYVANVLNNLGRVLQDRGDLAGAEAMFAEAIDIWEETLGPRHAHVSAGYYHLGLVAEERGDLTRAAAHLGRCLEIDRGALPAGHPYIADGAVALGRVLTAAGRREEATALLREALTIRAAAALDTLEASGLLAAAAAGGGGQTQ